MKILPLALVATVLAALPLAALANEPYGNSPPERTTRVNDEVKVRVDTDSPEYREGHRHNRHSHMVKVVKYRHGERIVTYRRVYD
jgi:Ni/Co efflux regulator RcnB